MSDAPAKTHEFKAEVAAVLRLVTNSLYTNREVFVRELVSNASDALDKARFSALVDQDLRDQDVELHVQIVADKARGVLVIEDNGIGMSEEEASQNLGTIAHSGTLAFLEKMAAEQAEGKKTDLNLIGQFGVGFYSAFMVADRIDVYSLSARPGHEPIHWSSDGNAFTVEPGDRKIRGTRIELHLKEEAKDFLDKWRIEGIIKRYSNFVLYPIKLQSIDDKGANEGENQQANAASAFWTRNPKELGDDDYKEFYTHVMGGFVLPGDEPLAHLHLNLDAPIQFRSVLYVPGKRPHDVFNEDAKGLQLYARRVLVMESCDKLLPTYLRFLRGVVDSEDLPLNVSREMLQEHQSLAAIRRQLTRKVLKLLADTAKDDAGTYAKIWEAFGVFLKEGLHTDAGHKSDIIALLRFHCTGTEDGTVISLDEYVEAMPEGQDAIYYITGDSTEALTRSPHLEACRSRGYAVLLMTDAVDEWVVQDLREHNDKPLRSVTQGDLGLSSTKKEGGEGGDDGDDANAEGSSDSSIDPLLRRAKEVLGERIKEVRASSRLTQSAACLVDEEGGLSRNMERILRMSNRDVPERPRILELNPGHAFVKAANELAGAGSEGDAGQLDAWIELLNDQANLAEGTVADPSGMVQRIQGLLDRVAGVGDGGKT